MVTGEQNFHAVSALQSSFVQILIFLFETQLGQLGLWPELQSHTGAKDCLASSSLNEISCQMWSIMPIMVIIMNCWIKPLVNRGQPCQSWLSSWAVKYELLNIKPLVNHGRLQDRSKEEELFFLVVHSLRWLSLGNLLNGVSMTHEY